MLRPIVVATTLLLSCPAQGSTFGKVRMTCPVGGRAFEAIVYASYSTFGVLPDGQPVGSADFPLEPPQCPDNGLVLFDEFDTATVKRLTPLVNGPEYQALRRVETRYFLAYWLQDRLGIGGVGPLRSLLAATWEAKNADDASRARRYNELLVERVRALPDDPVSLELLAMRARAANALRELGRFDEAEALRASLRVEPNTGGSDEDAAADREGWTRYLAGLRTVIARRDASRTPIDMLGERYALFRCVEPERPGGSGRPLSAFERDYCARPELRTELDALRARAKRD